MIPSTRKILQGETGFLLIAALTLLTALVIMGTTAYLLSSTDIKVGANFRNSQLTLQVAMAGAERARSVLQSEIYPVSGDIVSLSSELASKVGENSILEGSTVSDDMVLASGILNGASYSAYLTNDGVNDAKSSTADSNFKVLITSVATGPRNSKAIVETVVYSPSGLSASPATIYAKGDVTGNGSSLTINGNDSCGGGTGLAPIYTKEPASTNLNGSPTLTGSPASPQHGLTDIDIPGAIEKLRVGATTLTEDTNGASYGSASSYTTVYSWPDDPDHSNSQGIKLQNVTGYGILLVKGDLVLGGGFNWNGIIMATGSITLNGGGGDGINISGLIFAGTSTVTDVTINGSNTINYNSCDVKKALSTQPLNVVNWKQSY